MFVVAVRRVRRSPRRWGREIPNQRRRRRARPNWANGERHVRRRRTVAAHEAKPGPRPVVVTCGDSNAVSPDVERRATRSCDSSDVALRGEKGCCGGRSRPCRGKHNGARSGAGDGRPAREARDVALSRQLARPSTSAHAADAGRADGRRTRGRIAYVPPTWGKKETRRQQNVAPLTVDTQQGDAYLGYC